jgi:hypothetical protein
MTYYQTPAGARVFAAGAFSLADDVQVADVEPVVANIWSRLSTP